MVLRYRSLALLGLVLLGCGSTSEDGSPHSDPKPSPCKTEVFQLARSGVIDTNAKASAVVCEESTGFARSFSRADVTGSDLCPGTTEFGQEYTPECLSNADCGSGQVCLCSLAFQGVAALPIGAYPNRCVPAECSGPDDCSGYQCGISPDETTSPEGLYCRSEADECDSDLDCAMEELCAHVDGRWTCIGYIPMR